jgi:tetratricopeptide (TPR) repeat protein
MASRLIEQLDAAIRQADDLVQRECLKAERAGALARHGLLSDARFALTGVRSQCQRHRSARLNAWVSLVDGQIDHFESVAPTAAAKFQRAHELARDAGLADMQALCAAWLAMCSFNASQLDAMVAQIREVLALAQPEQHSVWVRIGLVLADAFRFAGDDEQSHFWYWKARDHASAEGDTSMISALLYNISAMRSARIGLDDAFGRADAAEAAKALLEAESTANYDWGSGAAALAAMVPLVRAQLLVVLGRHGEAVALFNQHLPRARQEGMAHREARFLADRAWSHLALGQKTDALRDVRQADRLLPTQVDADDMAATHARLSAVLSGCARDADAATHLHRAQSALASHQAEQQTLLTALRQAVGAYRSAA